MCRKVVSFENETEVASIRCAREEETHVERIGRHHPLKALKNCYGARSPYPGRTSVCVRRQRRVPQCFMKVLLAQPVQARNSREKEGIVAELTLPRVDVAAPSPRSPRDAQPNDLPSSLLER